MEYDTGAWGKSRTGGDSMRVGLGVREWLGLKVGPGVRVEVSVRVGLGLRLELAKDYDGGAGYD